MADYPFFAPPSYSEILGGDHTDVDTSENFPFFYISSASVSGVVELAGSASLVVGALASLDVFVVELEGSAFLVLDASASLDIVIRLGASAPLVVGALGSLDVDVSLSGVVAVMLDGRLGLEVISRTITPTTPVTRPQVPLVAAGREGMAFVPSRGR